MAMKKQETHEAFMTDMLSEEEIKHLHATEKVEQLYKNKKF